MNVQWRRLLPRDAPEVHALEKQCFTLPWSQEAFTDEFSHPERAVYFGAFLEACTPVLPGLPAPGFAQSQLMAYGGYWLICDEAHITNIAVRDIFRRQGYARSLMMRLINDAAGRGMHGVTLEVRRSNLAAQSLYESMGFLPSGVRPGYYADTQEDALIYWLKLNAH